MKFRTLTLAAALLMCYLSTAQATLSPVHLYPPRVTETGTIQLIFSNGDSLIPTYKRVDLYEKFSPTDTLGSYVRTGIYHTDTLRRSGSHALLISRSAQGVGYHCYYLIAFNDSGTDSVISNVRILRTYPMLFWARVPHHVEGVKGEEIKVTFSTHQPFGGVPKYELRPAGDSSSLSIPAGMSIDINSGELTWTPSNEGNYGVRILAYIDSAGSREAIIHTVSFRIRRCNNLGSLTGSVQDQNGNLLKYASVTIRQKLNDESRTVAYAGTGNTGYYTTQLDEGSYEAVVQVLAYDLAFDTTIAFTKRCTVNDTLNVVIHITQPQTSRISGSVSDAASSDPIPGARITLYGYRGRDLAWVRYATTDSSGSYALNLSIVGLPAIKWHLQVEHPDYAIQLYPGTSDPLESDSIDLRTERSGVDFQLVRLPNSTNTISGWLENLYIRHTFSGARVVAYKIEHNNGIEMKGAARFVDRDTLSFFSFTRMENGQYVLLAIPENPAFAPGYYKAGAVAVEDWQQATRITISDSDVDSCLFRLKKVSDGRIGKGTISGVVTRSGQSLAQSTPGANPAPVAGAIIYLRDENGNIVRTAISDYAGRYELTGLGTGTYFLQIAKILMASYSREIQLEEETVLEISSELSTQTVSVAENTLPEFALFPNPVEKHLTIVFDQQNPDLTVSVVNSLGAEVFRAVAPSAGGMIINTSGFASGVYYLRISSANASRVQTFSVLK